MGEEVRQLAYGSWPSPIDAALAAAHDGHPEYVGFVGDEAWWTEPRPTEGGRRTLVRRRADGTEESVLPAPWNVRSRVIEYGGTPWAGAVLDGEPVVVFTDFADQRLYRFTPGGEPVPLTPVSAVGGGLRWAEPQLRPERGEVWCVLEEFTGEGPSDLRRVPAAVPLDGSAAADRAAVRELAPQRHRFVTGPRLSPDGHQAAWLGWDHPRMPWDGTELLLAEVGADGVLRDARVVAGGEAESVCQADWAADGSLLYASDRSGWWNLYRDGEPLCPREEEFGGALWKLGQRWFAPLDSGLVAVVHGRGATRLGVLDPESGDVVDVGGPWTEFTSTLAVRGERLVGVGASPRSGFEVVEVETPASGRGGGALAGGARVIGARHTDPVDPALYPEPQIRTFAGPAGREIHAHVYPPHNPGCVAPGGELPPFVVWAHGGPTGRSSLVLDLEIAYFTSRGIGVAEVNYGGSTGYGREYRNRLREQWGVVDVEDCAAVALALAEEGTADRERLAVRGGSAGGWTAAASLVGSSVSSSVGGTVGSGLGGSVGGSVYACGTIIYPVLDLVSFASGETHDFESQYVESLVGPLDEVLGRYVERSPVEHADRVSVPFLLLQGLDDVICPPAQCERFLSRLAGRQVPHAYIAFEGEGHGFRRADTMVRALEAELSLYAQVFGLSQPGLPVLELTK